MSQSKSKHNHNKNQSPMGPNAMQQNQLPTDPESHKIKGDGNTTQNQQQNYITETGNQIKNNTPGGNAYEQRHGNTNKPRNNPQGNWPMSVDKSQKGPGRKAD